MYGDIKDDIVEDTIKQKGADNKDGTNEHGEPWEVEGDNKDNIIEDIIMHKVADNKDVTNEHNVECRVSDDSDGPLRGLAADGSHDDDEAKFAVV